MRSQREKCCESIRSGAAAQRKERSLMRVAAWIMRRSYRSRTNLTLKPESLVTAFLSFTFTVSFKHFVPLHYF